MKIGLANLTRRETDALADDAAYDSIITPGGRPADRRPQPIELRPELRSGYPRKQPNRPTDYHPTKTRFLEVSRLLRFRRDEWKLSQSTSNGVDRKDAPCSPSGNRGGVQLESRYRDGRVSGCRGNIHSDGYPIEVVVPPSSTHSAPVFTDSLSGTWGREQPTHRFQFR